MFSLQEFYQSKWLRTPHSALQTLKYSQYFSILPYPTLQPGHLSISHSPLMTKFVLGTLFLCWAVPCNNYANAQSGIADSVLLHQSFEAIEKGNYDVAVRSLRLLLQRDSMRVQARAHLAHTYLADSQRDQDNWRGRPRQMLCYFLALSLFFQHHQASRVFRPAGDR